ncbi:hypothetical protein M758_5G038800 [Ceratodon purpureus]|nr:hypothetical protein M758_5G038800 [Ceratodon purpureus]
MDQIKSEIQPLFPILYLTNKELQPSLSSECYLRLLSVAVLRSLSVLDFLDCPCARAAADMGAPIAILNIGPTRADDLAHLKISARSGEVLPQLLDMGSMSVPSS